MSLDVLDALVEKLRKESAVTSVRVSSIPSLVVPTLPASSAPVSSTPTAEPGSKPMRTYDGWIITSQGRLFSDLEKLLKKYSISYQVEPQPVPRTVKVVVRAFPIAALWELNPFWGPYIWSLKLNKKDSENVSYSETEFGECEWPGDRNTNSEEGLHNRPGQISNSEAAP